jgi:hypothetical protein
VLIPKPAVNTTNLCTAKVKLFDRSGKGDKKLAGVKNDDTGRNF